MIDKLLEYIPVKYRKDIIFLAFACVAGWYGKGIYSHGVKLDKIINRIPTDTLKDGQYRHKVDSIIINDKNFQKDIDTLLKSK